MSSVGWISLYRQIMDLPEYFEGKFDRIRCWIDLLLLAESRTVHRRIRGVAFDVEQGQIAVSLKDLCGRWGYGSKNTVMKILKEFEDDGRIKVNHKNTINIITIVNHRKYQYLLYKQGKTKADSEPQSELQNEPQREPQNEPQNELQNEPRLDNIDNINNNYFGGDNNAHTREEIRDASAEQKDFEELCRSEIWKEQVAMLMPRKIRSCNISVKDVENYLGIFWTEGEVKSTLHRNLTDMKQHFVNWLVIQLSKNRQNNYSNGTTQANKSNSQLKAERNAAVQQQVLRNLNDLANGRASDEDDESLLPF